MQIKAFWEQSSTTLQKIYSKEASHSLLKQLFRVVEINPLSAFTDPQNLIDPKTRERLKGFIDRLEKSEPIQYILGETEFYGRRIFVEPGVLIPRPETEELIDRVIRENKKPPDVVFDLCCGSGCIAAILEKQFPNAQIFGTDISETAIRVSQKNTEKAKIIQHDIFSDPFPIELSADIMVSNPPYVLEEDRRKMHKNVLEYEPHEALFVPENDPIIFYERIMELGKKILQKKGVIYFEIHEKMANKISETAMQKSYNSFVFQDINGKDRFIKLKSRV